MSEYLVPIKLELLETGEYLATSEVLQGLIAQGRTVAETMEIAEDVARKLIESCIEHNDPIPEEIICQEKNIRTINLQVPVSIAV